MKYKSEVKLESSAPASNEAADNENDTPMENQEKDKEDVAQNYADYLNIWLN